MRLSLMVFFSFLAAASLGQQDSLSKHAIYVDAAGPGGYWSLNYEYTIQLKSPLRLSPRIGFSTLHLNDFTQSFNPDLIFPVGAHLTYGNKHRAELGVGETLSSVVRFDATSLDVKRFLELHTYFVVGYRYQQPSGGILLRAFYSPLLEFNQRYRHWGGISIGYSF